MRFPINFTPLSTSTNSAQKPCWQTKWSKHNNPQSSSIPSATDSARTMNICVPGTNLGNVLLGIEKPHTTLTATAKPKKSTIIPEDEPGWPKWCTTSDHRKGFWKDAWQGCQLDSNVFFFDWNLVLFCWFLQKQHWVLPVFIDFHRETFRKS